MKKIKTFLIILTLIFIFDIQIFPLSNSFSKNVIKYELQNNDSDEELNTKPVLVIKEVRYNFKKCIFNESKTFNINTDNLTIPEEKYFKIPIPYLIINGEIKNYIGKTTLLYINNEEFMLTLTENSEYWYLWWKKDNDSLKFTFYNNGLNNELSPLIPIKGEDVNPKKVEIKIKCKDQKEGESNENNESNEVIINIYYSPKIWLKLKIGDTKVEEIKPDKQVEIQGRVENEPIERDWTLYQIYDDFTEKLKDCTLDVAPIIKEGRTLVPVRFIAEAFGAEVKYDEQIKEIRIISKDKGFSIYIYLDKNKYRISYDDKPENEGKLDCLPEIINGRTLVPLRFIAEAFGAKVDWDSKSKEIQIIYSTIPPKNKGGK